MKIGVVGCGNVGSTIAYSCVMRGVGTELVLIDQNSQLALSQAEDISHATPFGKSMSVATGTYEDLRNAGIVIIAAGVNQKVGETRLELLKRNAEIFAAIVPKILKAAPAAILLVATNPVDIMTHLTARFAEDTGHKPGKVIGSGTILDTARFRALLGQQLGISSHSVYAYVVGEHGDSEVLNWSAANVGNVSLVEFSKQLGCPITKDIELRISEEVRRAAYNIIKGKGATWFGIGAAMARIARAVSEDEHAVLTCCSPLIVPGISGRITLSVPSILSAQGVERIIQPNLNILEQAEFQKSAQIIERSIQSIL